MFEIIQSYLIILNPTENFYLCFTVRAMESATNAYVQNIIFEKIKKPSISSANVFFFDIEWCFTIYATIWCQFCKCNHHKWFPNFDGRNVLQAKYISVELKYYRRVNAPVSASWVIYRFVDQITRPTTMRVMPDAGITFVRIKRNEIRITLTACWLIDWL